jgi:hypothetical protein
MVVTETLSAIQSRIDREGATDLDWGRARSLEIMLGSASARLLPLRSWHQSKSQLWLLRLLSQLDMAHEVSPLTLAARKF